MVFKILIQFIRTISLFLKLSRMNRLILEDNWYIIVFRDSFDLQFIMVNIGSLGYNITVYI